MKATELAGEAITAKLTEAPGNHAKIGGLKVTTESAWFAARPSGTEDVYKIYAESFRAPTTCTRCRKKPVRSCPPRLVEGAGCWRRIPKVSRNSSPISDVASDLPILS